MNKLSLSIGLFTMIMLFVTGCVTTGESYTDEGTRATNTESNNSANNLVEMAVLPEIAAYDEPEIPALDAPATE